jgi:hypothetical protein
LYKTHKGVIVTLDERISKLRLAYPLNSKGIGIILSKHLILPVVCHAALSIITTAYLSFSVALDISLSD